MFYFGGDMKDKRRIAERKRTEEAIKCALEMLRDKEYPEKGKKDLRSCLRKILAWTRENDPDFLPAKKVTKILAAAGIPPQ